MAKQKNQPDCRQVTDMKIVEKKFNFYRKMSRSLKTNIDFDKSKIIEEFYRCKIMVQNNVENISEIK